MSDDLHLGKLAARFPGPLRELAYYAPGPLPAPPPAVAVPQVQDWGVLGNDRYGDCGVAGLQHLLEADAQIVEEAEQWPDTQAVVAFYLRYTGGRDTGVVLSDFLTYVRQHGYFDESVAAFAPVATQDVRSLQTAVYLFGGAYCGIAVTRGMMGQFQAGEPWTAPTSDDPVVGGHCVPVVGYDDQWLYTVTWGRVQPCSYSFWHRQADEAWAVLSGSFVAHNSDGRGVNLDALQADLRRLD